jgi:predicted nuclease of predicted toxin-antitoxin system
MPGQSDAALLEAAQRESRVVLTCDKDFGELAFHWGLPASCGVVLFRFPSSSPESFLNRFKELLAAEKQIGLSGTFCVVEANRVRVRRLGGRV